MTHRDLMAGLALEHGWNRGVELGLGSGDMFKRLLTKVPGLFMIGVDMVARTDRAARLTIIENRFAGRCTIHRMTTALASTLVEDGWADFVFIDAGHSYAAVRQDIKLWRSKVSIGGWFGGHDYHPIYPGVIRAVEEAFGGRVMLLDHSVWAVGAE